jgi:hypothetical protein
MWIDGGTDMTNLIGALCDYANVLKIAVSIPHKTRYISITKTNWLMLSGDGKGVYSENRDKHRYRLSGKPLPTCRKKNTVYSANHSECRVLAVKIH